MNRSENVLSLETIFTLAERETGAYGLADAGLRQRVAAMIEWANGSGPHSIERLIAIQRQLQQLLANRLRIASDRKRFPAIAEVQIERPVFIAGFARSGTTLLHSLLAEDPDVLAPQSWHILSPSPPPGAGPVVSGRIAFAQRAVEAWMDFCPGQKPMHPYIDKGAYQLCEDEELFTLDFRNAYPYHLYSVPTAEINVILGGNQVDAYRFHRELLQHLQWNTGKTRWICKGPSTQHHLDALFEVYPDALCVWPHRPLGDIYASNVALRAVVYDTISGKANDWNRQSRKIAESMKAAFDRLMASSMIDDPRIMHMPFREVAADPIAAVKKIYDRQGLPLTAALENRIKGWLADPENQVDRYGRYPYSYEAFGLDKKWIEDLFADYSKRFGL